MSKRMTTSELFEIAHEVPNGLVRKVSQGNQKAGNAVGTLHHSGYYQCTYQGKLAGTSYSKRLGKWQAESRKEGKRYYLGLYPTMELAHKAYKEFIDG